MNNVMEKYQAFQEKLAYLRWINLGRESAQEDALLEQMDDVWWELSSEEKNTLSSKPIPQGLIVPSGGFPSTVVDNDINNNPGPVRTSVV